MQQRCPRVDLDRKALVRCRDERAARHAGDLAQEVHLGRPSVLMPADVFEHGIRPAHVERAVIERKCRTVVLDSADLGVPSGKRQRRIGAERRHLRPPGVVFLDVIVGAAVLDLVEADVEHGQIRGRPDEPLEERPLSFPVVSRHLVREGHVTPNRWVPRSETWTKSPAVTWRSARCSWRWCRHHPRHVPRALPPPTYSTPSAPSRRFVGVQWALC